MFDRPCGSARCRRCVYDGAAFRWNVENYVEGVHTVEVRPCPTVPPPDFQDHAQHPPSCWALGGGARAGLLV